MKHRVINRDKIVEAWVVEPDTNSNLITPEGWRVMVEFDRRFDSVVSIKMDSESDCINFINSLNFVKI